MVATTLLVRDRTGCRITQIKRCQNSLYRIYFTEEMRKPCYFIHENRVCKRCTRKDVNHQPSLVIADASTSNATSTGLLASALSSAPLAVQKESRGRRSSAMFYITLFGFLFSSAVKFSRNSRSSARFESFSSIEGPVPSYPFGLRIDARTLTKEDFQKYFDGKYPVILTNVFKVDNEAWTNELMKSVGADEVEYDVRHSSDGAIESYQATLNEFLSSLSDNSDHDENMYLMNEDLLRNQTQLLDFLKSASSLFGDDLFEHFPKEIRPYQALIVGGVGARSFLHCDPYEWMGMNYLFEGRKLWTFLSPDVPSSLFDARRNAPDAWGAYNISAGWVSDMDLYRHRQSFMLGALAKADTQRKEKGQKNSGGLGKITSSALNNKWLQTALSHSADDKAVTQSDNRAERNLDVPIFMSGVDTVDYCEDSRLAAGALQFVQEEGDLVLIPPRFWHQVYHLEPSIALASQYINSHGKDRTFRHILNWCRGSSDSEELKTEEDSSKNVLQDFPKNFDDLTDKDQVLAVLTAGLKQQHGRIKGSALMRKLMANKT